MTDFPKQVTAEPSAESGAETQEGGQVGRLASWPRSPECREAAGETGPLGAEGPKRPTGEAAQTCLQGSPLASGMYQKVNPSDRHT